MSKEKLSLSTQKVYVASSSSRIKEVAEKFGIVLPSTHTALFQSVYAAIEEPNGNGIRLEKGAVEKALPGLIGSQVNLEHTDFMVGIILSAWLNDSNEIEIVFTFARNIFKEDYIRALEKMQEGTLSVSFELMSERDSQEILADGTVRLNDIDFQGVGLLIDAKPAYEKALVYDLAKMYKERVEQCKTHELVCAKEIIKSFDNILNEQKGGNIMSDVKKEELEVKSEDVKAEEVKSEEQKSDSKETTNEEAKMIIHTENQTFEETVIDKDEESTTVVSITTQTRKWEEELQVANNKVSELEATVSAQAEEIKTLKAQVEAFEAEKAAVLKAEQDAKEAQEKAEKEAKLSAIKEELKDNPYTKDFSDEDYFDVEKVQVAKDRKERDDFKAEVEKLKAEKNQEEKVIVKAKQDDLDTGHQEKTVTDPRLALKALGRQIIK
jgi:myosin heavy subunit